MKLQKGIDLPVLSSLLPSPSSESDHKPVTEELHLLPADDLSPKMMPPEYDNSPYFGVRSRNNSIRRTFFLAAKC